MKKLFLAPLVICVGVAPAFADTGFSGIDMSRFAVTEDIAFSCRFTQECIDTEACAPTTFAAALIGQGGGADATDLAVNAALSTDAGDQNLIGGRVDGLFRMMNIMESGAHMMSITLDGTALYSVHLTDVPMTITYHGTCEDAR